MAIYNFDTVKLMKQRLYSFLRQKYAVLAWLEAAAEGMSAVKTALFSFRYQKHAQLSYNSQVCYLRRHLNDTYDSTDRGIYIEDQPEVSFTVIDVRAELNPTMISNRAAADPEIISGRATILYNSAFNVFVPSAIIGLSAKIASSCNLYRLTGKKFKIIEI